MEDFLNHIYYEFISHGKTELLTEKHGYASIVPSVVKNIIDDTEINQKFIEILNTENGGDSKEKSYSWHLSDLNTTKGMPNLFFTDIDLSITISVGVGDVSGGYYPSSEMFWDESGKLVFKPKIKISVTDKNSYDFLRKLSYALGHEMTHAYNDYQTFVKTGKRLGDALKSSSYVRAVNAMKYFASTQNLRAVATIIYRLSRMERNAYIAQLKQELEHNWISITDSKSAYEAIKNTDAYKKNVLYLDNNLETMMNICDSDTTTKFNLKQHIEDLTKKKFSTPKAAVEHLIRIYNGWKQHFMAQASKIAYDVYEEHNLVMEDLFGFAPNIQI